MKKIGLLILLFLLAAPAGEASHPRGGAVLIQQIVASNQATVDFTVGVDDKFKFYILEFWGVRPATDSVELRFRVTTDGGSTWASGASDYSYAIEAPHDGTTEANLHVGSNGNTLAFLTLDGQVAPGNAANRDINGWVKVFAPSDTTVYKRWRGMLEYTDKNGAYRALDVMGSYNATTAVNGFRFLFKSGNVSVGTFRLYGLP